LRALVAFTGHAFQFSHHHHHRRNGGAYRRTDLALDKKVGKVAELLPPVNHRRRAMKKQNKSAKPAKEKRLPHRKISVSISGEAGVLLDEFCENQERTPSWVVDKLILEGMQRFRKAYAYEGRATETGLWEKSGG
jgi:hypothetical protein